MVDPLLLIKKKHGVYYKEEYSTTFIEIIKSVLTICIVGSANVKESVNFCLRQGCSLSLTFLTYTYMTLWQWINKIKNYTHILNRRKFLMTVCKWPSDNNCRQLTFSSENRYPENFIEYRKIKLFKLHRKKNNSI